MNCDNHPLRAAVGIDGNGSPLCMACIVDSHDYARRHAPEDAGAWVTYRDACAARLREAQLSQLAED